MPYTSSRFRSRGSMSSTPDPAASSTSPFTIITTTTDRQNVTVTAEPLRETSTEILLARRFRPTLGPGDEEPPVSSSATSLVTPGASVETHSAREPIEVP